MWLGSDSWRLIQKEITRFTSVWMSVRTSQNEISGQVNASPLDPLLKTFHSFPVHLVVGFLSWRHYFGGGTQYSIKSVWKSSGSRPSYLLAMLPAFEPVSMPRMEPSVKYRIMASL